MSLSLFIITHSGLPLYTYVTEGKVDDSTNEVLFSGMISAILSFLGESNVGAAKSFTTETKFIYIRRLERFALISLTPIDDKKYTNENLDKLLVRLETLINFILTKFKDSELPYKSGEISETLNEPIAEIINKWEKELKQSKASRTFKNGIW